ncbi:hypothetical protein GL4_2115 [Methyloceanibacter caenitepidi]|uniref:Uncharacterized protein n=1 Tax=Methyloceanibacter caenitepidi TaxID=1384459 RepID=A0A0A8K3M9_9HYPH|nr:hypothetical protein GL4_2115 [Methyloceanibacter caenitepidi]
MLVRVAAPALSTYDARRAKRPYHRTLMRIWQFMNKKVFEAWHSLLCAKAQHERSV